MYAGKPVEVAQRSELYDTPLHPYARALLAAIPVPDPEVEGRRARTDLRGDSKPTGCRFSPALRPYGRARGAHRHLNAGHRLDSQQALLQAHPEVTIPLGFDAVHTVSTRHQWFTRAFAFLAPTRRTFRAPSAATLTTPALDRRSLRWFEASPCRAASEGPPPSLTQPAFSGFDLLHRPLLQPSWHTIVVIPLSALQG